MSGQDKGRSKLTLYNDASDEIKKLVAKVIDIEKDNIHYKRPPRIKETIAEAVREFIK